MSEDGFVCDRCSRCCRHHRVPLTHVDLKRLENALPGRKTQDYLDFLPSDDVEMEGEPESFVLLREGRRLLALRHVEDDKGPRCVFLDPNGCTVHEARPSACRAYPYDRPDDEPALGLHPNSLCPEDSRVLVTLGRSPREDPRAAEFHAAIEARDNEASAHAQSIATWNKKQRLRLSLRRTPQSQDDWLRSIGATQFK